MPPIKTPKTAVQGQKKTQENEKARAGSKLHFNLNIKVLSSREARVLKKEVSNLPKLRRIQRKLRTRRLRRPQKKISLRQTSRTRMLVPRVNRQPQLRVRLQVNQTSQQRLQKLLWQPRLQKLFRSLNKSTRVLQ